MSAKFVLIGEDEVFETSETQEKADSYASDAVEGDYEVVHIYERVATVQRKTVVEKVSS